MLLIHSITSQVIGNWLYCFLLKDDANMSQFALKLTVNEWIKIAYFNSIGFWCESFAVFSQLKSFV